MRTLIVMFSLAFITPLVGCTGERPAGPVRSERDAISIAKRYAGTMAFDNTRVVARRSDRSWIVQGDRASDPAHPIVVTIDGASGQITNLTGVDYRVSVRGSKP
jgi:hypothetical protein